MEWPIADLLDRLSISELKAERIGHPECKAEAKRLKREAVRYNNNAIAYLPFLKTVNGKIWDLEADIRQGKEGKLGLEEVGRRALAIRELNGERVALKNRIAESSGDFKDIKADHASSI
jgi:hypothetical protein